MLHYRRLRRLLCDDRIVAALLMALTIATRLPLATRTLYSWDSVNFAFAMQRFDVTRHAPHPPGYLYYVGLAKLLDLGFQDANRSLVAISIAFAALSVAAIYLFGRDLFGRPAGVIAGLSLITSVTFWSYGAIALSYMPHAFFAIATAWLAYRILLRREARRLPLLTLVYSVAGGFRPDLLLFLGPLWLACLVKASWRERLVNMLAATAGLALWLGPVVLLSGGPREYLAVLSAYFAQDVLERYSVTHRGGGALMVNLWDLATYVYFALYAQAIPLLGGAALWIWRRQWRQRAWWLLAGWIAPMATFYLFVHIGDPGYVFAFSPALALLIGWGAGEVWRVVRQSDRGRSLPRLAAAGSGAIVAIALIVNIVVFLAMPKPLTAQGIRIGDRAMAARLAFVRERYQPDEVLLLSYSSFKHTGYYLPQYRHSLWVDRFSRKPGIDHLPGSVREVLIFDPDLRGAVRRPERWRHTEVAPGVSLYHLAITGEQRVRYSHEEIDIE